MGILGLDLSLTGTGIAIVDSSKQVLFKTTVHTEELRGPERWHHILTSLSSVLDGNRIGFACIEGYSFASFAGKERLGELGGIIRYALFKRKISWYDIPPSTLKKFITGKGTASKYGVMESLKQMGIITSDNNQADAIALGLYGISGDLSAIKSKWLNAKE